PPRKVDWARDMRERPQQAAGVDAVVAAVHRRLRRRIDLTAVGRQECRVGLPLGSTDRGVGPRVHAYTRRRTADVPPKLAVDRRVAVGLEREVQDGPAISAIA